MKIAVISDTHRIKKYMELSKKYIQEADVLIHLGDDSEDIKEFTKDFKGEIYGVSGNCDRIGEYPKEQLLVLEGKKIFITHGDIYGVKSNLINIYFKGRELEADIILFGHTHIPLIEEQDGIYLMNPGSVSLPRINKRYIGMIELEKENKPNIYLKLLK